MRLRRKDLALHHVIDPERRYTTIHVHDGLARATDGRLFAEVTRPLVVGEDEKLEIGRDAAKALTKLVPGSVRAKKAGHDYVEIMGQRATPGDALGEPLDFENGLSDGTYDVTCPSIEADPQIASAMKHAASFDFAVNLDLLVKAGRFLFDGERGTKELEIEVRYITRGGATYPIFTITNRNDPERRVVLAGMKDKS